MNSKPLYRIREWEAHFETHDSKRRKGALSWVAVPTKHDGRGFNRLRRQADWTSLYGCWVLILEVAAKCPVRGVLADNDGPFTAIDISDKVGAPPELVQQCLDLLSDPQAGIMWLEVSADAQKSPQASADLRKPAAKSDQSAADARQTCSTHAADLQQTNADCAPTEHNKTGQNSTKKQGASKKPKFEYWTWITSADLSHPSKVLDWHSRVCKINNSPLEDSDVSRINTLAAAAMALVKGDEPIAWFVWCVKTDKFKSITQAAEDAAHAMLKRIRKQQTGEITELFGRLLDSTRAIEVTVPEDEPGQLDEGGHE